MVPFMKLSLPSLQGPKIFHNQVNDYLSFPLVLDMAPYTYCPPAAGAGDAMQDDGSAASTDGRGGGNLHSADSGAAEPLVYHLVGVVVHRGAASHGHYYSLIRHLPPTSGVASAGGALPSTAASGGTPPAFAAPVGQWYKLDDDKVLPLSMSPRRGPPMTGDAACCRTSFGIVALPSSYTSESFFLLRVHTGSSVSITKIAAARTRRCGPKPFRCLNNRP